MNTKNTALWTENEECGYSEIHLGNFSNREVWDIKVIETSPIYSVSPTNRLRKTNLPFYYIINGVGSTESFETSNECKTAALNDVLNRTSKLVEEIQKALFSLSLPQVGQRICLVNSYWFDGGVVPVGATGTVLKVFDDRAEPTIWIKMDKDHKLQGNVLSFYPECGPQKTDEGIPLKDTLAQFHHYCKVVEEKESDEKGT